MFSCLDKTKDQNRNLTQSEGENHSAQLVSCAKPNRKTLLACIVVSLAMAILSAGVFLYRPAGSAFGIASLLNTNLLGISADEKSVAKTASAVASTAASVAGSTTNSTSASTSTATSTSTSTPDSSAGMAPASVAAIGRLEPLSQVSRVSVPAFLKDERILKLLVNEGDWLKSGQVICVMDAEPRLSKELQQAQEAVTLAKTQLNKVLAGAKLGEIGAAKANLDSLRRERNNRIKNQEAIITKASADLAFSKNEFERYKQLVADGAVSHSQFDAKLTTMKTNQAALAEVLSEKQRIQETLSSRIEEAEANLNRVAEVRPVDVAVAEAELKQAEARRDRVALDLSLCKVVSPRSGRVLKINARPGETIGSKGIIDLGNTQQMVAVAEVYQSDLPRLKVGQPAIIEGDGMSGPARGKVLNIGWEVARQSVFSQEPSAGSDARVVEVKIAVAPKDNALVEKLTNMQVECRFIGDSAENHDSSKR